MNKYKYKIHKSEPDCFVPIVIYEKLFIFNIISLNIILFLIKKKSQKFFSERCYKTRKTKSFKKKVL